LFVLLKIKMGGKKVEQHRNELKQSPRWSNIFHLWSNLWITSKQNHRDPDKNQGDRLLLSPYADGILMTDMDGRTIGYNTTLLRMGKIPESIIDLQCGDLALAFVLYQVKESEKLLEKLKEWYNDPEKEVHEIIQFSDGKTFELQSQLQRTEGKGVARVWSFHEITDHLRTEKGNSSNLLSQ